ncbi:hypothetical protein N577_003850 [Lacticaseibacillus rhamnosus 2166]|nr:hypothetical protein N577_003850 [Lacticaseibacillus rhamnosus 2166]
MPQNAIEKWKYQLFLGPIEIAFPVNFGMIPDSTCSMKVTCSSTLVGNLISEAGLFFKLLLMALLFGSIALPIEILH